MTPNDAMTVIQVLELAGKLATAALSALKSGATHVDFEAIVAKHIAGEARDDADIQAAAADKFGKSVKP